MSETKDISRERLAEFLAARLRARGYDSNDLKKPVQPDRPARISYSEENAARARLSGSFFGIETDTDAD